jgi:site-specific DNA-methyltransferase (adenine-specific)
MEPNADSRALPAPVFHDPRHHIRIYQGDCLEILAAIPEDTVDLIFADPPYFLSNDGITCHAGRMVSVNKGAWDRSKGALPAPSSYRNGLYLSVRLTLGIG